ncbi:MAG: S1C family serine protease [Patescibacteria group bacterium]
MKFLTMPVNRVFETILLAIVAGGASGTIAAFIVTPTRTIVRDITTVTSTVAVATSTESAEPSLVRLEPEIPKPLIPPTFVSRRASPVFSLYRKPRGTVPEDRTLSEDRELGQAVALTSDGWLVTSASVISSLRLSDIVVWVDGRSVPVERAFFDTINGTAYLKIQANDLTSPAFGQVSDLFVGSETWIEKRAFALEPGLVLSLRDNLPSINSVSSEIAARRIRVSGITRDKDRGAPVWNAKGALIGIVESATGEPITIVPVSTISDSFTPLLQQGTISHALLGVTSIDLSSWKIDGDRGTLPSRGSLIKEVVKKSPAAVAGLKIGDVILRVDRDIIDGSVDLGELLSEYRPQNAVNFRVLRNGEEIDVSVTLGSHVTSVPLK